MKDYSVQNTEEKDNDNAIGGISIRTLYYTMVAVIFIISLLLVFFTLEITQNYSEVVNDTHNHTEMLREVYSYQNASDYLTEQVRCFAETGDMAYLDDYFYEAKTDKRREKAVSAMEDVMGDSNATSSIKDAMKYSNELMDQEYYSMRLTAEAYDYDISELPDEIQNVELEEQDADLSSEEKEKLGRELVFDESYQDKKRSIYNNIADSIVYMNMYIEEHQDNVSNKLDRSIFRQHLLIVITIIIIISMVLLTVFLVIRPLLKAEMFIRSNKQVPVRGSYEFRYLAKAYNVMHEINMKQNRDLAFEATHDELTGIYNRSGYNHILSRMDAASSVLILIDSDKFKQINDKYGHEKGDLILKKISSTVKSHFRDNDHVCRIGGDEFAVIMEDLNPTAADPLAITKKIQEINKILKKSDRETPAISISCGVAFGAKGKTIEEMFNEADSALHKVKEDGGHGCRIYGE